jgi:hypothetical protein
LSRRTHGMELMRTRTGDAVGTIEPINGCERLLTDARIKLAVSRINTGFLRTLPSQCEQSQNASDGPLKAESSGSIPDGATN